MIQTDYYFKKGSVVLIAVLVISAIILLISISLVLSSIDEITMSSSEEYSQGALAIADSCLEEALLSLNRNNNYSGAILNLGDGSCTIEIEGTGNQRVISVYAELNHYVRKLKAEVTLSPFALVSRYEVTE